METISDFDYRAGWRDARNLAITLLEEKDDEIEELKEQLNELKK